MPWRVVSPYGALWASWYGCMTGWVGAAPHRRTLDGLVNYCGSLVVGSRFRSKMGR